MTSGRDLAVRPGMRTAASNGATGPANWRLYAACRGHDPEWWVLPNGNRGWRYRQAHAICDDCPVRTQCAQFAEDTGSWGMIFGGVDYSRAPDRRDRAIRERHDAIARLTAAGVPGWVIANQYGITRRSVQRQRAKTRTADELRKEEAA